MARPWHNLVRRSALVLGCLLLAGCLPAGRGAPSDPSLQPTPTVSAFFGTRQPLAEPPALPAPTFPSLAGAPGAPAERQNDAARRVERAEERIAEIVIYADRLDPNWSLEQSRGVQIDPRQNDYVYLGSAAIAVTPTFDFGTIFFTVRKDAGVVYTRNQVLGISFRLSGGPNPIPNDSLAVTVVGSRRQPYWIAGETWATDPANPTAPPFSETRLYFLGVNRTIPPDTWVEVVLWLDERQYDPLYTYVTGIYIKNDQEVRNPFYVDQVSLLVQEGVPNDADD